MWAIKFHLEFTVELIWSIAGKLESRGPVLNLYHYSQAGRCAGKESCILHWSSGYARLQLYGRSKYINVNWTDTLNYFALMLFCLLKYLRCFQLSFHGLSAEEGLWVMTDQLGQVWALVVLSVQKQGRMIYLLPISSLNLKAKSAQSFPLSSRITRVRITRARDIMFLKSKPAIQHFARRKIQWVPLRVLIITSTPLMLSLCV